jgi:hypothetical protein
MKWDLDWNDPLTHYLESFETLVGDRRTWITLTDCRVRVANGQGGWQDGSIAQARAQLRLLARADDAGGAKVRTAARQTQAVTTEIWACPLQLSYETNVRRSGPGTSVTKTVWLIEVRLLDTYLEPWLLVSDWEVEMDSQAVRLFQMYRQRWGVEESFNTNSRSSISF